MLSVQRARRRNGGFIVTNLTCSTVGVTFALAPLHDAFGVEQVSCVTLQAISGAGYPGVPALAITDSAIPHIAGETSMIESEPRRILGRHDGKRFVDADFVASARVHHVPVTDGPACKHRAVGA